MNTRRIIENGFYGLFTAIALIDKYGTYAAMVAIIAAGVYWWPDSKIYFMLVAGMFALAIVVLVALVVIGTVARSIGYAPDFGLDIETPKED